ncbi:unnamed protein product [Oikopleura dioica]|uniref:ribonuclease H n=1 Tax=Oikopleura dioica TaxID=34765 RepID=E4WSV7_OIKDI|nr:unnamed protein product [Oikopleura dioica]
MVNKKVNFATIGETVDYGITEVVAAVSSTDRLNAKNFQVDSRKIYLEKIEKLRTEAAKSTTVDDVVFGELVEPKLKSRLKNLLASDKYKKVFAKRIGCLNSSFNVQAHMTVEIKEENIGPRRKSEKLSDEKKQIIAKNLDELYRDGVLVFPEDFDIRVKNIIPLMVVGKTDDNGEAIPLAQSARIVTQAHTTVNRWSKTPPMPTDDLNDILRQAAKASKFKYSLKCDISQAFFQLPMAKELWKWFGVYHPFEGVMCYTRCTQGWVASMGFMRQAFLRVFSPLNDWLLRYADDVHLIAKTEDEFVEVIGRFLDICAYHKLTLKGSKMHVMPVRMNFLGAVIKDGRITASPHQASKIRSYSKEKITSVSELRSFLGLLVPLSKFQNRPTDYLVPLRKLLDADGKVKIQWSTESERALERAKESMNQLVELTPFEAKKQAYVVVDSSADGCGAILFQKDESTEPPTNKVCEFYSRKRPDAERKFKASSCMLECAGAIGALCYWRRYFIEAREPVILFTDSRPFACIAKRWAENLVPSDIVHINNLFKNILGLKLLVRHLPGKSIEISGVDFISRSKSHMENCNEDCKICILASTPKENEVPFVTEKQMEELSKDVKNFQKAGAVRRIQVHQVDESMSGPVWNMYESWTDEVDHEIEAFELVSAVMNNKRARKLNDFLNDGESLRRIQQRDNILRQAIKCIEGKLNPPPRQQRLATLCRKAYVRNRHLRLKKWIGTLEVEVVIIPENLALEVVRIVHDSTMCQSPSQLAEKVRRHFEFPNIRVWALKFSSSCYKCSLLKKPDNYRAKPLKPVSIPSKIGEVVLLDEINRMDRNKRPFKIFFATEALTRFGVALPTRTHVNSDSFVDFCYLTRQLLAPLKAEDATVIIRTDAHSAHVSRETKNRLDNIGMKVEIFESTSMSKNLIPEQDARIAVLSKFLNAELNDRETTIQVAVQNAVSQYNHVLGNRKLAPVEIFTGRRICTQKPVEIDVNDLVYEIEAERTAKRESVDRSNALKQKKKDRLILKPVGAEVNGTTEQILKVGDVVRLNKTWDKADLDRLWKVVSLNWNERTFQAVKYNISNAVAPKTISVDIIDAVISHNVRKIQESLFENPAARMWSMRKEDLSIWEDSDWNPQGQRAHNLKLLDDSAISLGPSSTLPPTPMPEMDPDPCRTASTPTKANVLNSTFNSWLPEKFVEKFTRWTGSPETPETILEKTANETSASDKSDSSFHSVASNSSALNESDIQKLYVQEPRRSSRVRKQTDFYTS